MGEKSRKAVPPAMRHTDMSDEVAQPSTDDNNNARTLVPGFDAENDRLHRKYGKLEKETLRLEREIARLTQENSQLDRRLKRCTGALWTGFVTLEAKAAYCMSIASWGDNSWWANAAQAATGLALGGYLIWPNVRRLIDLSSGSTDDSH